MHVIGRSAAAAADLLVVRLCGVGRFGLSSAVEAARGRREAAAAKLITSFATVRIRPSLAAIALRGSAGVARAG